MTITDVSLGIAVLGLVISILTFIFDRGHTHVRIFVGVPALLIALLFGLIWIFSFYDTSSGTPSSSDNNCLEVAFQVDDLGLWVFGQSRPAMPAPAGECEVIFAHGDINDTGTCHIKEFNTGEAVQGLGNGTFRLMRISGNSDQIKAEEARRQQAAATGSGGSCPWLP